MSGGLRGLVSGEEEMARVDRAHFHYPGSYQGEDPAGGTSEWQLLSKEVPFVNLLTFGPSLGPKPIFGNIENLCHIK